MKRPGLLRRAAAATLGVTGRSTTLTVPAELSLVRRAAAAVIGIHSYQPTGSSSLSRVWEVRAASSVTPRGSVLTVPPPSAGTGSSARSRPPLHDVLQTDLSDELALVLDPATTVVIRPDKNATQQDQRKPRHALVLTAMAAVLAVTFTVFGYQLRPFVHPWPLSQSVAPSPSTVVSGDVPASYLGSWHAAISNSTGDHFRSLVIKQGHIGDDVLILVADGSSNYHCVFTAPLTGVSKDGRQLNLGPSAVTSAIPSSACHPGSASIITLKNKNSLRRIKSEGTSEGTEDALTYTR